MFTGIIEQTGRVESIAAHGDGARLVLSPDSMMECHLGDSLSVNGACLTVATISRGHFEFDLSAETLRCSNFGKVAAGDLVNLERALKVGDRLGGHFVSGHVDGVATVVALRRGTQGEEMEFLLPPGLAPFVAAKGSIAVDGVSLTPFRAEGDGFSVALVPHTLTHTTLGFKQAGDKVNIEVDLLARYLKKMAETP